jgi:hypothetical protein
LSVRELEDGRVLLHCFAGCGAGDVLSAIGLRMADLFDKPIAQHLPPIRGGFSARELLELTAHEVTVASIIISDTLREGATEERSTRLAQAAGRIAKALEFTHGH